VKMKHGEVATRLLAAAMICGVEDEAVDLIRLYWTWLEHPPDTSLIYAVLGYFLDSGKHLVVREICRAVREDWRIKLEAPLYIHGIYSMLQLPDDPVGEALELYKDAKCMGTRLPLPLHRMLLDRSLQTFENAQAHASSDADSSAAVLDSESTMHLNRAMYVFDELISEGYLTRGADAATLCSVSWLYFHISSLPQELQGSWMNFRQTAAPSPFPLGDWKQTLGAALQIFGCQWGFAAQLPSGLFRTLECSSCPHADQLVKRSRLVFGRFYP